jgi:hypothetical protein
MTNFHENLHAHVATASADCDGPMYHDYVTVPNDAEIAEHEAAQGVNDFSDIHFMNRVFTNHVSPYAVRQLTAKLDDDGFTWHEDTEEGYRAGEVRWCRDDCDESLYSQRDVYAEMMGY